MTKQQFKNKRRGKSLKEKLVLEKTFIRDLKSYFNSLSKSIKDSNGFISIDNTLEKHYTRIVKKLTDKHPKKAKSDGVVLWKVENQLSGYTLKRIAVQSKLIDDNTKRQIKRAELIASQDTSSTSKSLLTARILKNMSVGRYSNIAITETSQMYEKTRGVIVIVVHEELRNAVLEDDEDYIDELADYGDDYTSFEVADKYKDDEDDDTLYGLLDGATKEWETMGDELVREWHSDADGQEVGVSDFFNVMGELLFEPGDVSMGASAENVCNCRCSAVYL